MKQIAMLVIGCCLTLSINGCSSKEVVCVKPTKPNIPEAKIEQCRYSNILDNSKCVLNNYVEVKQERDMLRNAIDRLTE